MGVAQSSPAQHHVSEQSDLTTPPQVSTPPAVRADEWMSRRDHDHHIEIEKRLTTLETTIETFRWMARLLVGLVGTAVVGVAVVAFRVFTSVGS